MGQEFSCRTLSQEVCAGHSRRQIFISKVVSYLAAFNLMALVYPFSGCIREFSRFGIASENLFLYHVSKAVFYSFMLNSAVFLIAIFFCCCFQNAAKAVAVTAVVTFVFTYISNPGSPHHSRFSYRSRFPGSRRLDGGTVKRVLGDIL